MADVADAAGFADSADVADVAIEAEAADVADIAEFAGAADVADMPAPFENPRSKRAFIWADDPSC